MVLLGIYLDIPPDQIREALDHWRANQDGDGNVKFANLIQLAESSNVGLKKEEFIGGSVIKCEPPSSSSEEEGGPSQELEIQDAPPLVVPRNHFDFVYPPEEYTNETSEETQCGPLENDSVISCDVAGREDREHQVPIPLTFPSETTTDAVEGLGGKLPQPRQVLLFQFPLGNSGVRNLGAFDFKVKLEFNWLKF